MNAPRTPQSLRLVVVAVALAIISNTPAVASFAYAPTPSIRPRASIAAAVVAPRPLHKRTSATQLHAEEESNDVTLALGESETTLLGAVGTLASGIVLYSESVLFRTGCGLPAGPLGLVGAAEGVSYLGVVALVGYSAYTKIRTGKGLPPGPGGILGAAEGLSYLALLAGIFVFFAQVTNYGYIPNAIPMEGGMCK